MNAEFYEVNFTTLQPLCCESLSTVMSKAVLSISSTEDRMINVVQRENGWTNVCQVLAVLCKSLFSLPNV